MPAKTIASITINAPRAAVFKTAAGISPSDLIKAHGPLPGIISGDGHDTPWEAVGQKRRHMMSDGSSVNEELTAFALNDHYAYRVSDFTGPFAKLVDHAIGEWRFTEEAPGKTRIDWTYKFFPKGALAAPIVTLIVKALWPGYLNAALERVKECAEAAIKKEKVGDDGSPAKM